MPTTLPRRTWLLLAVTITIQLVILRSTRALKQDELQDRADLTRNGDPFQASSAIYPRHLLTILQTALLAVPYERWYADTPAPLKPLVGLGFIIVLVFLFSFIGISASDFFCPNLSTIAAYLGLNESTAGVTFLAFGNGSPDVFSTFSALKGGTFGLAIGELIGAASFIVSIVVGTIALIRPFHVPRHTFIRDILFFTTAVVVLIAVLHDGHLTVAESGGMVVLYISYVGVVVAGNWWSRHRQDKEASRVLSREREHRPSLPELSFPEPTVRSPDSELLPLPNISTSQLSLTASPQPQLARARSHTTSSRLSPRMEAASPFLDTPRANFSLLGAIEFRDVVNSLRRESESRISSPSRTPLSPVPERDDYFGVVKIAHRRSISHQGAEILRGEPRRERRAVSHIPRTRPEAGPSPARPHPSSLEDPTSATPKPNVSSCPDLNPWKDQPGRPDRPRIIIPAESHAPSRIPSISVSDPTGAAAPPPVSSPWIAPQLEESRFQLRRRSRLILRVIFPSLQSFRHKSYVGMTLAVLSVPAILALTLTLPVVDDGQGDEGAVALPMTDDEPLNEGADQVSGIVPDADEDRLLRADVGEELHHLVDSGFSPLHSPLGRINYATLHHIEEDGIDGESISKELLEEIREEEALEFHKSLTAVQCVLGPMFCALVIFRGTSYFLWVLLAAGLAGGISAAMVWHTATDGTSQTWKLVRCFAGFTCSMVWIAAIADEVVSVLQAVGLILGLSDAIIGLTIFAVGNSLADLVANVTVAQFAPAMAYAACFGGPMLNLLLGVGGSGSYHMLLVTHEPVTINFSPTLWVSASGLVIVLVATAIFVPLNGYLIDRRWAGCLIVAYAVLMVVNVMVEVKTGRG